jgi:hypothetical protein
MAALIAEIPVAALLEIVGIRASGGGLGGFLWSLHLPGILILERFRMCCGYDHFVISDGWVTEVQHPYILGLATLAVANALLIGLLLYLVWTLLLAVSRRGVDSKAAA